MSWRTPLWKAFDRRIAELARTLAPATIQHYRDVAVDFLLHVQRNFPEVQRGDQLRRDPHLTSWMEQLVRHQPPLKTNTRLARLLALRRLLCDLAELAPYPPRLGLIRGDDLPRAEQHLPRPLQAEDDERLQRLLGDRVDLISSALILQRQTGLRMGELVRLAPNCLHHIEGGHWVIRVPAAKSHRERWVPVDEEIREVLARLAFLRLLVPGGGNDPFLLPRPRGLQHLEAELRSMLKAFAREAGCSIEPVPHQLRHTYASWMLRHGVSLVGVMKLLGHSRPYMTLAYIEVTQADLQREFLKARDNARHSPPPLPAAPLFAAAGSVSLLEALRSSLYLLDCLRHKGASRRLDPFRRRLVKLIAVAESLAAD